MKIQNVILNVIVIMVRVLLLPIWIVVISMAFFLWVVCLGDFRAWKEVWVDTYFNLIDVE